MYIRIGVNENNPRVGKSQVTVRFWVPPTCGRGGGEIKTDHTSEGRQYHPASYLISS